MGKLIFSVAFICSFFELRAQQQNTDTLLTGSAGYAKHLYDGKRANESAIYTGVQFYPYSPTIEGIAFFDNPEWQTGWVIYDHVRYDSIVMKLDLVKEQVVVSPDRQGGLYISLFSPRVSQFVIGGMKFLRLGVPGDGTGLPEGFYQVLAQGKLTAYARKTKYIFERVIDRSIVRSFESVFKYYVLKDGIYHHIRKADDLFDLVKDRKKEVQKALSSKGIKFRKNPEGAIITAIELYNK